MILLNFSSKFHSIQFDQFKALTSLEISEQVMLPTDSSSDDGLEDLLDSLFKKANLTEEELHGGQLVVHLPSQTNRALKVLAYVARKCGNLPLAVRTSVPTFALSSGPTIMEVLDLEKLLR
jgi:hypothetical protein